MKTNNPYPVYKIKKDIYAISVCNREYFFNSCDISVAQQYRWFIKNKKRRYLRHKEYSGFSIYFHNLILKRKLGQKFDPDLICHHINGNIYDNTRANLVQMGIIEHACLHNQSKFPFCVVPECNTKHHAHGYCQKHYYQYNKYGVLYI